MMTVSAMTDVGRSVVNYTVVDHSGSTSYSTDLMLTVGSQQHVHIHLNWSDLLAWDEAISELRQMHAELVDAAHTEALRAAGNDLYATTAELPS